MKLMTYLNLPLMGTFCWRLFEYNERALIGFLVNDYVISFNIFFINFIRNKKPQI